MKEYEAFSLYPDTLRALHHPHPDSPLLGRGGGGQMLAVARRNVRRGKEREKEEGGIEGGGRGRGTRFFAQGQRRTSPECSRSRARARSCCCNRLTI